MVSAGRVTLLVRKVKRSDGFGVAVFDAAQLVRVVGGGTLAGSDDGLVADEAGLLVDDVGIEPAEAGWRCGGEHVGFERCRRRCVNLVPDEMRARHGGQGRATASAATRSRARPRAAPSNAWTGTTVPTRWSSSARSAAVRKRKRRTTPPAMAKPVFAFIACRAARQADGSRRRDRHGRARHLRIEDGGSRDRRRHRARDADRSLPKPCALDWRPESALVVNKPHGSCAT